jgi:hypothetical protein
MAAANRRISILLPYTNVPEPAGENAEALAANKKDSIVGAITQPIKRNY